MNDIVIGEIPIVRCEICMKPFKGEDGGKSALECEAKGAEPFLYNVGDLVLVKDFEGAGRLRGQEVLITTQLHYIGTHKKEYDTSPSDPMGFLIEEHIARKVV